MTDQEWEERQKTRQLEMEACSKALAVLSADDAHDTFTRTFSTALMQSPALMQTEAAARSSRQSRASALLTSAAEKAGAKWGPRLSMLARRVRLDAFEKVKQAINDMIAQLQKEKEDE